MWAAVLRFNERGGSCPLQHGRGTRPSRIVVWDIGANVGLFTFCASALAGTKGFVSAVEPDYWLAHLITRSVHANAKNHSSTVELLCAGVSDSNRVSKLQIAEGARASNHLADATGSTQAH